MDWLDYREKLGIGFCDKEKYEYFKAKIISTMNMLSQHTYLGAIDIEEYYAFCNTTGTTFNTSYDDNIFTRERFKHCVSIISQTGSLNSFLAYYVALVNSIKIKRTLYSEWTRTRFADLLCDMLTQAHIPFDLVEDNEEYFVFPKGAKEMDDALVSQPLQWLTGYPTAHRAYIKALKEYANAEPDNASDVADKFRKALEAFFQEFFGGNKSLENYKGDYGAHLKKFGIPKEIRGNLEVLLQAYTSYINSYAKHKDATSDKLLEYLMYQTGNIIRLLITLK